MIRPPRASCLEAPQAWPCLWEACFVLYCPSDRSEGLPLPQSLPGLNTVHELLETRPGGQTGFLRCKKHQETSHCLQGWIRPGWGPGNN